ncbi:MAG: hypothetical protein LBC87_04020 [Fibromonadaceae bacterium]|nr:hypothetical protein [Fibromonadaceae bacterium]
MKDSHEFYSSSFAHLLVLVGVIITVFVGGGIWNWWRVGNIRKTIEKLNLSNKNILREFASNYLSVARTSIHSDEFSCFMALNNYCNIYLCNKLEMNKADEKSLDFLDKLIEVYKVKGTYPENVYGAISLFLYSFKKMRANYGKIEKINEISKRLRDKFKNIENGNNVG